MGEEFVDIDNEIRRIKNKRKRFNFEGPKKEDNPKEYVNSLIARSLSALILFFIGIILMNTNKISQEFIRENILTDNLSFAKIGNVYNKFFGSILPFEKIIKDESSMVFRENLVYEKIDKYMDGFVLSVSDNYLMPVVQSGVVVFIGEKEGLGNTVIVQGSDEVDYWYSNITNVTATLYDYLSKGSTLGTADGKEVYMTFKKDGEFLDFDEVIE